jgi:hypothetical protein
MVHRAVVTLVVIALVSGCDARSTGEGQAAVTIPAGWQPVTPLAGGGGWPGVSAALPGDLKRTREAGIDSQMASYEGRNLYVGFDYGAAAHPGCPPDVASCDLGESEIAGRPARASISAASPAERPFRSIHVYFVPLVEGGPTGNCSSEGAGLLVTVKCSGAPNCADAERIASTIRLTDARRAGQ